ncbi:MAG TPA: PASTA domain-containing protein, partial [Solirubrobacteraceae bacterium]|nr:PASTA domain-containing protein [Solirubrobacteraceae bacterium]
PPPPPELTAPPAPPAPAGFQEIDAASGEASLVLRPADPAVGAAGVPAVEAGAALSFEATVRNESQIVDNYDLAVLGLPEGWTIVTPAAAFLVPLGSGRGETELALRVDITPPRDHRSTAGIWTFELVALSRTHGTVAARAVAQFEVRPFEAWSVEVVPVVNTGRLKVRYRTAVRNDGNAEQVLWLTALDDSGRLRTRFAVGRLALQAGDVGVDTLTLRPRFPRPIGRVTEHRVGVDAVSTEPAVDESALSVKEKLAAKAKEEGKKTASGIKVGPRGVTLPRLPKPRFKNPLAKLKLDASMLSRLRSGADANAPLTARQVVFRQKPLIPLWLIGVIALIAIAAVLVYLLWPQKASVPPLVGVDDAFVAEKMLREEGLVLSQPVQRRVEPDAEPGEVVEQSPAAGTSVDEGASVSIVVAAGTSQVEVPRLKGLTRVKADERLREEGLELGETQPADAPDKFVVRSQIPAAQLSVERGTAVRVFLTKPPTTKKEKAAAKKEAAAAAAADKKKKAGAAAAIKIPEIDDKPVKEYTAALEKLGLKPKVSTRFAGSKAGTVIAVVPKPGEKAKKGDSVAVRASAGLPPLAVQTGSRVLVVNPIGGRPLSRLPAGGGTAVEPSYLPDGDDVVYRSGARIIVQGTARNASGRTLYAGPDALRYPSAAPNGVTLAVLRREEDDGDLCFGRIDGVELGHLCLPDDGWDLYGRPSWRKDGKAVVVPGRRRDNSAISALRVYRSRRAFAQDPLLWRGRTATAAGRPGKGVIAAAYSPGGTRLAAISNLASDNYQVVLTDASDVALEQAQPTETGACDVTWRPDGLELVAVQSDAACSDPAGKVVRFSASSPKTTTPILAKGRNPVFRPG